MTSRPRHRAFLAALVAASLVSTAASAQSVQMHANFTPEEIAEWTDLLALHVRPKDFFRAMNQPDRFRAGVLYVQFDPATAPADMMLIANAVGIDHVMWQSSIIPGMVQVQVDSAKQRQVVNTLLDRPEVLYAEPEYLVYPTDTIPDDEYYDYLWGMPNIRAPKAWDASTGASAMRIAIIDTGITTYHDDLEANLWTNPGEIDRNDIDDDGNGYVDDIHGYNFFTDDGFVYDEDGDGNCGYHGTHVSGTVGARGNNGIGMTGVMWRCDLIGIKCGGSFYDDDANEWVCTLFDLPQGLEYALIMGAGVSNHSYGGGSYQQAHSNMILAAQQYEHIVVAAAGNGGDDDQGDNNDNVPHYPSGYSHSNIIAVAALTESDQKAGFSNYGVQTVDLLAPGVDIFSTSNGDYWYVTKEGTSMAAPHVTGAVAMIQAAYGSNVRWFGVRDRVLHGVRTGGGWGGLVATGGTLDLELALHSWVDFDAVINGTGSRYAPYNSFSYALVRTPAGFTLSMHAGSDDFTGVINNAVTLDASGGSATLGE